MDNFAFNGTYYSLFQRLLNYGLPGSNQIACQLENLMAINLQNKLAFQNNYYCSMYPHLVYHPLVNGNFTFKTTGAQIESDVSYQFIPNQDFFYSKAEPLKLESEDSDPSERPTKKEDDDNQDDDFRLRAQITAMVHFFIDEFGKVDARRLEAERKKYVYSKPLISLFDSLQGKYSAAGKCREDMLRLALRKALTSLRDSLRKQLNISAKNASLKLCERYFGQKLEEVETDSLKQGRKETEILSYLLPYKKNSKHSTPNAAFIREIFASENFSEDYALYLSQLDEILDDDNDKKITKFIDFLVACVQKNQIHKIKTFKRLPWLKTWLKATTIIATELLEANTVHKLKKKKTKDEYVKN